MRKRFLRGCNFAEAVKKSAEKPAKDPVWTTIGRPDDTLVVRRMKEDTSQENVLRGCVFISLYSTKIDSFVWYILMLCSYESIVLLNVL